MAVSINCPRWHHKARCLTPGRTMQHFMTTAMWLYAKLLWPFVSSIFWSHCYAQHKMWPIVAVMSWSVCLFLSVCWSWAKGAGLSRLERELRGPKNGLLGSGLDVVKKSCALYRDEKTNIASDLERNDPLLLSNHLFYAFCITLLVKMEVLKLVQRLIIPVWRSQTRSRPHFYSCCAMLPQ